MAFHYSLQTLLHLRQSLERQEEQRLFAIAAFVAQLRAEIGILTLSEMESRGAQRSEMRQVTSGASLQFAAACEAAFDMARKKLELQLREAEDKRLSQLHKYQAVRLKREILEKLREREESEYRLAHARHEQQAVDEAFLIRSHLASDE